MYRREYVGPGRLEYLTELLSPNAERLLLVTGANSFKASGARERIRSILSRETMRVTAPSPNPTLRLLSEKFECITEFAPDAIIAIGGGAVIDSGKAISTLPYQRGEAVDYVTNPNSPDRIGKPLIAIPTTAGTGSETTHFATIYHNQNKYSLAGLSVYPSAAIVDPSLSASAPRAVRSNSGADALSQAIESFWSKHSTPASRRLASAAISLALDSLEPMVANPTSASRRDMAIAAHLSGKAIDIANTTACHSVSYPMTSYFGVPHGAAVALTLPAFLEYNADVRIDTCQDPRGVQFVHKRINELSNMLGVNCAPDAAERLRTLFSRIGLPTSIHEVQIDDVELLINNGFAPDRIGNNPRRVEEDDLRDILNEL